MAGVGQIIFIFETRPKEAASGHFSTSPLRRCFNAASKATNARPCRPVSHKSQLVSSVVSGVRDSLHQWGGLRVSLRRILITTSQMTGYTFNAAGTGSLSTPEIPGFFAAAVSAPGQTVLFDEGFLLPSSASSFTYGFVDATTTPEPAEIVPLSLGLLGLAGVRRLRRNRCRDA